MPKWPIIVKLAIWVGKLVERKCLLISMLSMIDVWHPKCNCKEKPLWEGKMNVYRLSFLALLLVFGALFIGHAFALESKHSGRGLVCADCHQASSPAKAASEKACITCHGDYQKVAALTRALHANPHDSHLGPMDCTKCHKEHRASEISCLECHNQFEFKNK